MASCNQSGKTTDTATLYDSSKKEMKYGVAFDTAHALAPNDMMAQFVQNKSFSGLVSGNITDVCQHGGCWANLDCGDGKKLFVKFRQANDNEFAIEKGATGRGIIAHGVAYYDTTTVEDLKKAALEDGKSEADVAKITQPEIEICFKADGAYLKAR